MSTENRSETIAENTIELAFSSNPKFMKLLRKNVEFACQEMELPDCKTIVFAIDEACTNIIRHAYKMDFSKKITVVIQWIPQEKLEIFLSDFAEKIDPNLIQVRDLNEVRAGQMGVSIYHEVMDIVEWVQGQEVGNTLHFVKYYPKPKPEPEPEEKEKCNES